MNWDKVLEPIKETLYFNDLWGNVEAEYEQFLCFPPKDQIFRALDLTPFNEVKVVILGQDPYHDVGQANGLSFSVSDSVLTPPSLRNIYKELIDDLGIYRYTNELDDWAEQGVLLLNACLTVRAHQANSHKNLGWETFSDYIIKTISEQHHNIVFILWGGFAEKKKKLIDLSKHLILSSAHPSPLSSYRGFFGSKPFSKTNNFLLSVGKQPILW